jgi:membrane protein YqaA with SNARE-associated domain
MSIVESVIEALRSVGALGILLIAIIDSSFLSIPEINDILVVTNVAKRPDLFYYWPLLTTAGSVIGCFILYWVARKGGQMFLPHRGASRHVRAVEAAFARYGSLALIIPALCPPPTPFKTFVAVAGALQFPVNRFIILVTVARSVRYFAISVLAVFYGVRVEEFIKQHAMMVALIIIAVVSAAFFVYRVVVARLDAQNLKSAPAPGKRGQCA